MTEGPTLYGKFELSLTEAEKRLAKFNRDLDKTMGVNERRAQLASKRINQSLASSTSMDFGKSIAAGALAGIAGLLSLSAVIAKVKDALNEFGDIADKSGAAGLNAETFQEYAYAASLAGVEVNELGQALAAFSKNAGLAEVGKGKMVMALKKLNPELLANIKATQSQEERLKLAVDAIDAASTASQKAALSSALFGDAGTKLVGVFKGGSAALNETAKQARSLGIIISNELIERADELGDQFDTAARAIDLQFKAALIDVAPLLVDAARFSAALASALIETVQALRGLDGNTTNAASQIGDGFDEAANQTIQLATIIIGALTGRAIGGLIAKLPAAVTALRTLAAALTAASGVGVALARLAGPIGLVIGVVTTAVAIYADWGESIDDNTRKMAEQAKSSSKVQTMIDQTAAAHDAYKQAIANSAKAQTAATNSIVADTKREFESKKSLLELELKRQQALMAVQAAAISAKSAELKGEIGFTVTPRMDTDMAGLSDPKIGRFVQALPVTPEGYDMAGIRKTQEIIDNSPVTAELRKMQAQMDVTKASADKLNEAIGVTFGEKTKTPATTTTDATVTDATSGAKGGAAPDKSDDYKRAVEQLKAQTLATLAQSEAQAALNPVVNDYGFALEKAKAAQVLLTAAQKDGVTITPELAAEIAALSGKYAEAEAASKKLTESQDAVRQSLSESAEMGKDVFGGIIQGLRDGASAGEILSGVLEKIVDKKTDPFLNVFFQGAR